MRRHHEYTTALGRAEGDRFATAVLLGFPADRTDVVDAVVFGHEPPLAVGPGGVRILPVSGGLPIGYRDLAPGAPGMQRVPVAADETLLLVTDGVTEARDGAGRFYRLAEQVGRAVARDPRLVAPARLVAFVRDGTLRHCRGHLVDDTTAFAVRRTRAAGGDGHERGRSPY